MPTQQAFRNAQLRHAQYYKDLLHNAGESILQNKQLNVILRANRALLDLEWEIFNRGSHGQLLIQRMIRWQQSYVVNFLLQEEK